MTAPPCPVRNWGIDKHPRPFYNNPKAMKERDGDRRPQRAGGWCKPAARGSRFYGS